MTRQEAYHARQVLLYGRGHDVELRIRNAAEAAVRAFDATTDLVRLWNIPWQTRSLSALFGASDAPLDSGTETLTVLVPGSDFAAQLVVERQIREQVAAL